jgi:hypothetical protein
MKAGVLLSDEYLVSRTGTLLFYKRYGLINENNMLTDDGELVLGESEEQMKVKRLSEIIIGSQIGICRLLLGHKFGIGRFEIEVTSEKEFAFRFAQFLYEISILSCVPKIEDARDNCISMTFTPMGNKILRLIDSWSSRRVGVLVEGDIRGSAVTGGDAVDSIMQGGERHEATVR